MLRQGDQRADADARSAGGLHTRGTIGRSEIGRSYPDRAPTSVGQPDDHESGAASRTLVCKRKSLAKQRMLRVRDRDLRHHPIENDGILRCSATRPMPMPSWTASFTTLTASNSPAKACVGLAVNKTRRLDQTSSPVTQNLRPARLATRAASFRCGGRHHSGIPGAIIPLYPGDFVGIRMPPCASEKRAGSLER